MHSLDHLAWTPSAEFIGGWVQDFHIEGISATFLAGDITLLMVTDTEYLWMSSGNQSGVVPGWHCVFCLPAYTTQFKHARYLL